MKRSYTQQICIDKYVFGGNVFCTLVIFCSNSIPFHLVLSSYTLRGKRSMRWTAENTDQDWLIRQNVWKLERVNASHHNSLSLNFKCFELTKHTNKNVNHALSCSFTDIYETIGFELNISCRWRGDHLNFIFTLDSCVCKSKLHKPRYVHILVITYKSILHLLFMGLFNTDSPH